jgi:S-adenosylmethionine synthetase
MSVPAIPAIAAPNSSSHLILRVFPLSPKGIIDHLDLRKAIYRKTAAYGHFGRKGFAWERVDATEELLAKAKKAKRILQRRRAHD